MPFKVGDEFEEKAGVSGREIATFNVDTAGLQHPLDMAPLK